MKKTFLSSRSFYIFDDWPYHKSVYVLLELMHSEIYDIKNQRNLLLLFKI